MIDKCTSVCKRCKNKAAVVTRNTEMNTERQVCNTCTQTIACKVSSGNELEITFSTDTVSTLSLQSTSSVSAEYIPESDDSIVINNYESFLSVLCNRSRFYLGYRRTSIS